jgi:hypothetical protein
MDFYAQSTSHHPSQLHIRPEVMETSQPPPFPSRYTSPMTHSADTMGGSSSQVFVGSPWGTGGYLDELPLMEGKYVDFGP